MTGSATEAVEASLARIAGLNTSVNAFTAVTADRARARAARVDAGEIGGPLAGMPFAVKNLFDIAGLPTRAGAALNTARPPATDDAALIRRLEAAGAILVGALNMGEYAYDFTGENVHDGPSRNPHDLTCMTGGSSGGSAAAVAAGMVPLALGSDTNGSIRVPAALCGVFGLKPTYGRLSRAGTFPFVASLDHLGPFARSVSGLAGAYDAMQGGDPADPAQAGRAAEPVSGRLADTATLRVAVLGGWFRRGATAEALAAVDRAAAGLGAAAEIELPDAERARAAAYLITMGEGAALHLDRLRHHADGFDPDVRDRLLAGAMLPAAFVQRAQKFRRRFRDQVLALFRRWDILLAPCTPCSAPKIGRKTFMLDGVERPIRPNLGLYTQPISFIGLPVAAVPVPPDAGMPLGVQIIAAPWREDVALQAAHRLEMAGIACAPLPPA